MKNIYERYEDRIEDLVRTNGLLLERINELSSENKKLKQKNKELIRELYKYKF